MSLPDRTTDSAKAPRGAFVDSTWDYGPSILQTNARPLVMGILNLTPDSFHQASRQASVETAVATALTMAQAGADVLDLGAESSRPGAQAVTAQQEQQRLIPVIRAIRQETDLPLTVDTVRAETAAAALVAGADAINDISGGADPEMLALAAKKCCGLILMHMQGTPGNMQDDPQYEDVVKEVGTWLEERCKAAQAAGIKPSRLMVDPGIGFGKTLNHNLTLINHLDEVSGGLPLLLGASRKSFIGMITQAATEDRLPGSLAALALAFQQNTTMVRVHDVAESVQFLEVLKAISRS